jgi:hypothetical protein
MTSERLTTSAVIDSPSTAIPLATEFPAQPNFAVPVAPVAKSATSLMKYLIPCNRFRRRARKEILDADLSTKRAQQVLAEQDLNLAGDILRTLHCTTVRCSP